MIAVSSQRALLLLVLLAPCVALPQAAAQLPSDAELERSGAVIGKIIIDNLNIFDLNDPQDDTKLFRLADHLHARTRERVIRWELLFVSGDRYSRRVLEESERLLRLASYFYDASIEPIAYHDGRVDVLVKTRDVWTLDPGISYGRSGGTNSTSFQLQELNAFGYGTAVTVGRKTDVDRTQTQLGVQDNNVNGSRIGVQALYSVNSDGYQRDLFIDRLFYALDSRWTAGLAGTNDLRVDSLYDRGNIIDQFQEHDQFARVYGGWSHGLEDGWVTRWTFGATSDERQFESAPASTGANLVPADRKLVYPWMRYELIQDDYLKYHNYNEIERTEDFYLGTRLSAQVGWSDPAFGANIAGLVFSATAGYGLATTHNETLIFTSTLDGRLENGTPQNTVLTGSLHYYFKQSEHLLFYAGVDAAGGRNLDLDNQILLGGDNGLRGYPLRYQDGTSRALVTLEERYFTDWYPFRLFRVGAAAFADVGRTWGTAALAEPGLGILRDVGLGLRFGNSRSGLGNIIHVDLAFPLDGDPTIRRVQFLVVTKATF
jgi:outer membrane protein assembly factor BamA